MEFALSPTQQLLTGTAREFLNAHCPPSVVETLMRDASGFSESLWRAMAELGWPGLLIPPALGGSGGTLLDVVLLVEEMGRAGLPSPYVDSSVVATSLLLASGDPGRERWLTSMAVGDRIVTLARAEDDGASAPEGVALRLDGRSRLSGRKLFVKDAHVADAMIVSARAETDLALVVVERDRPGVHLAPMTTMSGERRFEVRFADLEVRPSDRLQLAGSGIDTLAAAVRAGALARAAEMVGAAQRILDLVVDHAKVRVQSGRPIGSFQAIQHTCADLLRNVEGARWIVRRAAWKAAERTDDAAADAAMAKAWAGEACLAVARRAHQVLGAIGYCDEHPLHIFHKRIHAAAMDFGTTDDQLDAIAEAIGLQS